MISEGEQVTAIKNRMTNGILFGKHDFNLLSFFAESLTRRVRKLWNMLFQSD